MDNVMKNIIIIFISLLIIVGVEVIAASTYQTNLPIIFKNPLPIQTPTPTSIPIPYGIHILPNSYIYESGGMTNVIGEVLNNTDDSLYNVSVTVEFYNNFGTILGTGSTLLTPLNLPPREQGCFILILYDVLTDWSYYIFDPVGYELGSSNPDLKIIYDLGSYNSTYGDYEITGLASNDGNQSAYSVGVGGTLYNAADVPVGCEYGYLSVPDLEPGQGSDFYLFFSGSNRDYYDVDDYRLRVAGDLP
jgi:hypothetical protein